MVDPAKCMCPITREHCRKDCAWCVEMDVLTEDWAGKQWYCSVNLVASHLEGSWAEWTVER